MRGGEAALRAVVLAAALGAGAGADTAMGVDAAGQAHVHPRPHAAKAVAHSAHPRQHAHAHAHPRTGPADAMLEDLALIAANTSNGSAEVLGAAGSFLQLVEKAAERHTGARAEAEHLVGADVRAHAAAAQWHQLDSMAVEGCTDTVFEDGPWTNLRGDHAPTEANQADYVKHKIDQKSIFTGLGYTCDAYKYHGWCWHAGKACIRPGYETNGRKDKKFNFPEKHCCICGKGNPAVQYCDYGTLSSPIPHHATPAKELAGAVAAAFLFVLG